MSKTILITGSSSGIGKCVATYFQKKGWNVAATMRNPDKEEELTKLKNVKCIALDVTESHSIRRAISQTILAFGGIDVVVNNAGYGAVGIFEKATSKQIQHQFDVNVFGVMNVIREVLPHFREKKDGTIINITSMGGLITFPIYSVYHGTKWAMEGFAESLHYELRPFNLKVKNVEPGAIKTDFYDRSQQLFVNENVKGYDSYEQATFKATQQAGAAAPGPQIVAKTVYKAATSRSFKLRYPVSAQTKTLLFLRRWLPQRMFFGMVRMVVEKGYKP